MATEYKPGSNIRVTLKKSVTREGARKTIERLFMKDKTISRPISVRSANFKELPKRRGGQIWTKRPNKVHPKLERGTAATIKVTPQTMKDLDSVADFVDIASA